MINSVSGVSFRGQAEDFQKLVQSEGKFSSNNAGGAKLPDQPAADEVVVKKKGKAGKIIGGTLAAVVVAGLALFGLKRGNVLKIDKDATGIIGKSLSKLAEAGEWIGTKMIDPLLNLFKGKKAKDAADAVENIFA